MSLLSPAAVPAFGVERACSGPATVGTNDPFVAVRGEHRRRKPPFPVDLDQGGPSAMRDILTAQGPLLAAAVAGLPSLGVPTGVVDGLPTGVQVVADRFREDLCFEAGEAIERAADMGTPIDPKS